MFSRLAKEILFFLLVLLVYAAGVISVFCLGRPEQKRAEPTIPSIIEVQEFLAERGYYEGKLDGRCGPQTLAAWNRYKFDEYAEKWFEKGRK